MAHHLSLPHFAQSVLGRIAPAHREDLYNALAGMTHTERVGMMNYMVERAEAPMVPPTQLTPVEDWWLGKLTTGIMLDARREEGWIREFPIEELTQDYITGINRWGLSPRGNATAMGRYLRKVMPKLKTTSTKTPAPTDRIGRGGPRVRHYEMPSLDNARRLWDRAYGKQRWPSAQGAT